MYIIIFIKRKVISMKKYGFTLSEVLITLGVIGAIAAITLPTLIKNYQKHVTVNRLKHAYSLVYQAVRMSETENGLLENWNIPSTGFDSTTYNYGKIFFEQYLKPYIKVANECSYRSAECWAEKYTFSNGVDSAFVSASTNHTYGVVLANGIVLGFFPRGDRVEVYTDLNGKKGPNQYGKDFYNIVIVKTPRNDGYGIYDKSGVYMFGQGRNRSQLLSGNSYVCSKNSETLKAGNYCGALIMSDGWKISNDYPW